MPDHNPYAPSKAVDHDEGEPLPLQRTGIRWRKFPAALLAAAGALVVVTSFAPLLFDDPVVLLNVETANVVLLNVAITNSSAILCFAAGCSWLVSANALERRRWSRAVVWLVVGIASLGAIAWLN